MVFDVLINLKDRITRPFKNITNKIDKYRNVKVRFQPSGLDEISSKLNQLKNFAIGALIGTSVLTAATDITQTAARIQTLDNTIRFASGSIEEGNRNLEFLEDTVERLKLPLLETKEGFRTLSGAMMGTSLEGEPARDVFESVAIAASAMGLNSEQVSGTFLALGQIMSKGTVQAEELRGQLGERLPGAFQIAARAMGVSTQKLGDMMKEGALVADEFLPKFAQELRRTFEGGVENATQSIQAHINELENLKVELATSLIPSIAELFRNLVSLKDFLGSLDWQPLINGFLPLIASFAELWDVIMQVSAAIGFASNEAGFFNQLISFLGIATKIAYTPLRLLVELITLLGRAFVVSAAAFSGFEAAFKTISESIRDTAQKVFGGLALMIKGAMTFDLSSIKQGLSMIKGAFKETASAATDSFTKAFKERLKELQGSEVGILATEEEGGGSKDKTTKDLTKKPKADPTKDIDQVVSDAKSHRNITVHINKLNENIVIRTTNINESATDIEKKITEVLLKAVRNFETAV